MPNVVKHSQSLQDTIESISDASTGSARVALPVQELRVRRIQIRLQPPGHRVYGLVDNSIRQQLVVRRAEKAKDPERCDDCNDANCPSQGWSSPSCSLRMHVRGQAMVRIVIPTSGISSVAFSLPVVGQWYLLSSVYRLPPC